MSGAPRFEAKYRLGAAAYLRVRGALLPYCESDRHSLAAPQGRYVVRSLYFDTPGYDAYADKMEGVRAREKFRVRAYADDAETARVLKVERKVRDGGLIRKYSDDVAVGDFLAFMAEGRWGASPGETLDAFSRARGVSGLRPTALIRYRREAFRGKGEPEARFTFDHDVESAWTDDLFLPAERLLHGALPCVVFEIKTSGADSPWLSRLIRESGLAAGPNSKYAGAFERSCPDVLL